MHRKLRALHRAVSLALRLGITKKYGPDIMVGEEAKNAVPGATFLELDRMWAKGEGRAAAVYYEPLEVRGQIPADRKGWACGISRSIEPLPRTAQRRYRHPVAGLAGAQALGEVVSRPCRACLCTHPPGSGWDGAFTFETK